MGGNDSHLVRFSTGTGKNLGRAQNQTKSLKHFVNLFKEPVRTKERQKDYAKLPEEDQKALKSVAGWLYRTHVTRNEEGKTVRNRSSGQPSDMVSFDFDYATPAFLKALLAGKVMGEYEWMLHTSRRHHPEKPRVRLFLFLASPIPNDHYPAVSRIIARMFDPDMEHVDKVSFRPAQMMFFPTASADQEYIHHRNEGSLIDPQAVLDDFELIHGDWRDIQSLPKVPGEELREVAEKAEDPTAKAGPVGDFCRAYSVPEAIEAFLSDKYEPVDAHTGKPRYTYLGGTTTNGAEVQDDGLFLYSHHGSDPVGDMLVNAFDLVRIHLFGDQDKPEDRDTAVTKRPSYLSMVDFIQSDSRYKAQVVASRYGGVQALRAQFDDEDVDVGDDEEVDPEIAELVGTPVERNVDGAPISLPDAKVRKKRPAPADNWIQSLELTQDGRIISNAANIAQIIDNDLRTRNCIAFNEFTSRVVIREDLHTRLGFIPIYACRDPLSGTSVEDHHVLAIRMMLESPNGGNQVGYGLRNVSERDINGAVDTVARRNPFHPVRDYLKSVKRIVGSRAELLFIKYLGCPDTPYYREAGKLFMLGAVARAFEPGHKFDFVPILFGGQGKRKSTFINIMGKGWYGELKSNFKDEKQLVEQMMGTWINELPELSSIGRSSIEDVKAFISGLKSSVRLSYDRRPAEFPRQCVFIGSTNDEEFLIDSTGNRRFWPIKVYVDMIDTDELAREIDALWADAYAIYRQMRKAQPTGFLPLDMRGKSALEELDQLHDQTRVSTEVDHYAELLGPWLDRKTTGDDFEDKEPRWRDRVTITEAWIEGMGMQNKMAPGDGRMIGKALRLCGWAPRTERVGAGTAKVFRPTVTVIERRKALDAANQDPDDLV